MLILSERSHLSVHESKMHATLTTEESSAGGLAGLLCALTLACNLLVLVLAIALFPCCDVLSSHKDSECVFRTTNT
ncbi:hypothetical protein L596_001274 [Steinernema carpocapsae]|uniref:Uncharacterized protein n=1 Tax=Steinernema carpocapsae TaxID=34508 RepID=A0A4U8UKS5_STECR|nr:hypothetical protein L596_001274 [Steinernema carpocapsae]